MGPNSLMVVYSDPLGAVELASVPQAPVVFGHLHFLGKLIVVSLR